MGENLLKCDQKQEFTILQIKVLKLSQNYIIQFLKKIENELNIK